MEFDQHSNQFCADIGVVLKVRPKRSWNAGSIYCKNPLDFTIQYFLQSWDRWNFITNDSFDSTFIFLVHHELLDHYEIG